MEISNVTSRIMKRFVRFLSVTCVSLPLELILIWVLFTQLNWHYISSLVTAFIIVLTIRYAILRKVAFYGTRRGLIEGYAYYLTIALTGTTLVITGSYLLIGYLSLNVYVARLLLGIPISLGSFLLNLYFNFKVAPPDEKPSLES